MVVLFVRVTRLQLQGKGKELYCSGPMSQVVPSGAIAGFTVTFAPSEVQDFHERVTYTINDKLTFNFGVTADVGPIICDLKPPSLYFEFGADSTEMEVKMSVPYLGLSMHRSLRDACACFVWRCVSETLSS